MPSPGKNFDATQKVANGIPAPALWAKAMRLVEGDEEKARYRYITPRVEKNSNASATASPKDPRPIIDSSGDGLRPKPDKPCISDTAYAGGSSQAR